MTQTDPYPVAGFLALITGDTFQFLSCRVQNRLDRELIQGLGKIKTPSWSSDRCNNPRLTELKKNLFQKYR